MNSLFVSKKQEALFKEITHCEELIFACGVKGISANIVGSFNIEHIKNKEDRLNMGDGTNHVHIDWSRVKRMEVGRFHNEGLLTFWDGDEGLFRFYQPSGDFPAAIVQFEGDLL